MWYGYGIISDVVVCSTLHTPFSYTDIYKPFTVLFPHANIHELLAPDLLHQIIKGTFKDHLIDWITKYILDSYGNVDGKEKLAELDR